MRRVLSAGVDPVANLRALLPAPMDCGPGACHCRRRHRRSLPGQQHQRHQSQQGHWLMCSPLPSPSITARELSVRCLPCQRRFEQALPGAGFLAWPAPRDLDETLVWGIAAGSEQARGKESGMWRATEVPGSSQGASVTGPARFTGRFRWARRRGQPLPKAGPFP